MRRVTLLGVIIRPQSPVNTRDLPAPELIFCGLIEPPQLSSAARDWKSRPEEYGR